MTATAPTPASDEPIEEEASAAAPAPGAAGAAAEAEAESALQAAGHAPPERRRGRWRRRWFRAHPSTDGRAELATFPDLVRAHRAWERELYEHEQSGHEPNKLIEREFHRKWRQFERRFGRIDDAYWSVRDASAVALTIREQPVRWRPDPELVPRFHRATDWATRDESEIAELLDACETLAVRVEEILLGSSELIALRRINAVASHLLGFVDRAWGRRAPSDTRQRAPDEAREQKGKEFVERQRKELERVECFYNEMGSGQARILFFWGMVQGLAVLVVLTGVVVAGTWFVDGFDRGDTHWGELQLFVMSIMAGALGALLSVLTRMASLTGKFALNHELGRQNVRWIGIYRPFVGGIFGLATFLMLASGILQTETPGSDRDLAYYGILAFISGFFERFTRLGAGGVPTPLEKSDNGTRPSPTAEPQ